MIPGDGIFYDMAENVEWIQSMRLHQFQLGIAELFDPLAFYILRLIGIERIVATSNMPLQSIFYHYLGYLEKIIQKGDIPGYLK
uniref:A_deaminase domain-containing protein n=1 Tax=Meloidogyne hapla TaxID=6305 RepID=A0A1I8C101_MELHA